MKYTNYTNQYLADLTTPVGLYLKLRERYSQVLLLESSDYSSKEDSSSFLCFDALSEIVIENNQVIIDGQTQDLTNAVEEIDRYTASFSCNNPERSSAADGVFGYCGFDAVQYFDTVHFNKPKAEKIPSIRYAFYRFAFIFDHFHNTLTLVEHCPEGVESALAEVENLLHLQDHQTFDFSTSGAQTSNMDDTAYLDLVQKAKAHCQRGDVFQLVLSRQFRQKFNGDEFNVYRALRSINPSPYLFYFDFGSYKIFGSSPEAQLKVEDGIAEIHPIAGTFKRTGDYQKDLALANELLADPKENAEHVMLVDLARNDLSKSTTGVKVETFKEVQFFSHVIHLVSKVTGTMKQGLSAFQIFADTFPAGTLSGAPKYRALQLIDEYEPHQRSFYGGGIGMIGFNGNLNHAIIIRSFLSQGNELHYQAGAGLVINSVDQNELQEVFNKLTALKKALELAQTI